MNDLLEFNGTRIRSNGDMLCINDLYAASGCTDTSKEFKQWKRFEGAKFIAFVSEKLKVSTAHLLTITRGRNGLTHAHWQIGIAYAKYLDHALHMEVNNTYARVNGGDVTIIDEVFDKQTLDTQKRITKRLQGKVTRNALTDTLQNHGVVGIGYAMCTDAIYQPLFGGNAKTLKSERNLTTGSSLRDNMAHWELVALDMAEMLAQRDIDKTNTQGNKPCAGLCAVSANKVASIL
jgi:hypothetical protein